MLRCFEVRNNESVITVISSIPVVEHMGYSIKLPVGKILIDIKLLTLNMILELVLLKTYYYLRHKKM